MKKPNHIPKKAWDKALELQLTAPAKWRTGVCAGAWIDTNGEINLEFATKEDRDYCYKAANNLHGYVCHSYVSCPTLSLLLFDTHTAKNRKFSDEEANLAFFSWMMNDSPVSNFILNDNLSLLAEGGAIIDAQRAGPAVLLWICKAFRVVYEEQHRIPLWYQLVRRGVNPLLALCTAHCVRDTKLDQGGPTHCSVFYPPHNPEAVKLLLSTEHLPVCKKGLKETNYNDWETNKVFNPTVRHWDSELLPLARAVKIEKVPDGWGGFVEKKVGNSINDLAKRLLDLEKEYK